MDVPQILSELDRHLPDPPFARSGGSLLLMAGLPGSGKSLIVEKMQAHLPCVVISTDCVRLFVWPKPTYAAAEVMLVYEICHRLVEGRLSRGQRVVFDGTNHLAERRQELLRLAERWGATAAVCQVQAAPEIVRHRLTMRNSLMRRNGDLSQADWAVYQGMEAAQQPISGPHLILDSTCTPPEQLAEQLQAYWLERERVGRGFN
jgi:predicted kinase